MAVEQMDLLLNILHELMDSDKVLESDDDVGQEVAKPYLQRFQRVYDGKFRHSYSQISLLLEKCSPDVYISLEFWISALLHYAEKEAVGESVEKGLAKLLDHIELEGMRLDRAKAVERYRDESNRIKDNLDIVAKSAMESAAKAQKSVENYHEQSIAILGIFSAVILAFMGGVSFSSGVLESISKASMFRLLITVLLLGFVLFNSVFVLMRFIAYIVYKKDPVGFKNGIIGFNATLAIIAVLILAGYAYGLGETIEKWGQISSETTSSTSADG